MVINSKRNSRHLRLKQTIYIVCEGTNTEPNYFNAIDQELDKSEKSYSIEVYPSKEDKDNASKKEGESIKTDAVSLVQIAQREREIENYDEVWVVFDKDGYTKHQDAFLYAKENDIKLAFSSIAFEHWILLHYEQNRTAFPKSQNVIDYLEQAGYFPGYKKADIYIYARLKDLTKTAIENAAWLRMEMANHLAACDNKIYELNLYTTVDELVRKLLDFNPVTYGYITQTLRISDYSITVNDVQRDGGITLSVSIVNHGKGGYLVNNHCNHFYLKDEKQKEFPLVNDTTIKIEPSSTQDIALEFEISSATGQLRLHFSPKQKEILIIALDNITEP